MPLTRSSASRGRIDILVANAGGASFALCCRCEATVPRARVPRLVEPRLYERPSRGRRRVGAPGLRRLQRPNYRQALTEPERPRGVARSDVDRAARTLF